MKKRNDYDRALGNLYDVAPKSVLAAVAVSYASVGGDYLEKAHDNVLREWWALFENRIVAQKPPFPKPDNGDE